MKLRLVLVVLVTVVVVPSPAIVIVDDELDVIIVEAEPEAEDVRESRQLLLPHPLVLPHPLARPYPMAPVLYKDQPCTGRNGEEGVCVGMNECFPFFKLPLLYSGSWQKAFYDHCYQEGPNGERAVGVCCNQKPKEKSEEIVVDAEEVADVVDVEDVENGHNHLAKHETEEDASVFPWGAIRLTMENPEKFIDSKIVNGIEATQHEFPFMATLLVHNRQFCGGSLIDHQHILTAAHCVAHFSPTDVKNLRVRLGDHDIKVDTEANHIEVKVKQLIKNKRFSSSTLHNDIAILKLKEPISYSSSIQPIRLASGGNTFENYKVWVAGWGTLKEGGVQPGRLMKVDVDVWSNSRCKSSYGSAAPGGITEHMLCASSPNKDSCSGDSGGPLFYCNVRCTQVGIVSWGIGCAQAKYPGVYTRVSQMLDWIDRLEKYTNIQYTTDPSRFFIRYF